MVDSGADGSSLPVWIAEALEIPYDRARIRVASGAGGDFPEYAADTDVVIHSEIGPVTLIRPSINAALPFMLFGRRDFFDGRRVCFDQRTRRIEIR
ncbi:MAG: hypothetical protein HYY42_04280 [Chloroflexi bacterium]|nr:hypothetical protein [Chloroflexota bacterium]MBI2983382.1 hypothetical protein [Chloroflexota bacterium]